MLYEVHIPRSGSDEPRVEHVHGDNWLDALRRGLAAAGLPAPTRNLSCDLQDDESVVITDTGSGLVFRVLPSRASKPDAPLTSTTGLDIVKLDRQAATRGSAMDSSADDDADEEAAPLTSDAATPRPRPRTQPHDLPMVDPGPPPSGERVDETVAFAPGLNFGAETDLADPLASTPVPTPGPPVPPEGDDPPWYDTDETHLNVNGPLPLEQAQGDMSDPMLMSSESINSAMGVSTEPESPRFESEPQDATLVDQMAPDALTDPGRLSGRTIADDGELATGEWSQNPTDSLLGSNPELIRHYRPTGEETRLQRKQAVDHELEELRLMGRDIHDACNFTLDVARAHVPCGGGAVMLIKTHERTFYFAAARGPQLAAHIQRRIPLDAGVAGVALQTRRLVNVIDPSGDPRFSDDFTLWMESPPHSILCVPVFARKKAFGMLELIDRQGRDGFTQEDSELLALCAQRLGEYFASLLPPVRRRG